MREALEAVRGVVAIENIASGQSRSSRTRDDALSVEDRRFLSGSTSDVLRSGAGGKVVQTTDADRPMLTGDPEWDALELEETDPSQEPLKIQY